MSDKTRPMVSLRRYPIFEAYKSSKPPQLLTHELRNLGWTIAPCNRCGNADKQNVDELVPFGSIDARIIDGGKTLRENIGLHDKTAVRSGNAVHGYLSVLAFTLTSHS